jgi:hypothetical protein
MKAMRDDNKTPLPDQGDLEGNNENKTQGPANDVGPDSGSKPPVPHLKLISHQLRAAVRNHNCGNEQYQVLVNGTFDLFASLKPKDAIGAVLATLIVGLHNQTMEIMATTSSREQDLRLKYSVRGAATIQKLLAHYEQRRKS